MSTQLGELKIDEVSGVDAPANQLEGWLVMKSKDELVTILKEVDRVQKDSALLWAALEATDLEGAPDEVTAARETIVKHLESLIEPEKSGSTLAAKVRSLLLGGGKAETEPEAETVEEPAAEEGAEKSESETGDPEPEPEKAEKSEEAPAEEPAVEPEPEGDSEATALLKQIAGNLEGLQKDIDTLKEVASATIDRVDNLEGGTARSQQVDGQEVSKGRGSGTLRDGVLAAASGRRVTIR